MQLDWGNPFETEDFGNVHANLTHLLNALKEREAVRNYLVVLVGRQTEDRAFQEIREITQGYPTTTASDVLVTRYQPIRKPGNWRFMAVARITVGESGRLPELRPEMHLIAVD